MDVKLPVSMMGVGALCGVMLNLAVGFPPYNVGGILGGIVTGLMMYLLGL